MSLGGSLDLEWFEARCESHEDAQALHALEVARNQIPSYGPQPEE